MNQHRVIVNVRTGAIVPVLAEAVEVAPGKFYTRSSDGTLSPIEDSRSTAAGDYVTSGWHDSLAEAYSEAADGLSRQSQAINALRLICEARGEVVHA